jgi:hypothetical protein
MIEYARLTPGAGFRPINAMLYYPQRLVTLASLRAGISLGISTIIRRVHGTGPEWIDDEAESEAVGALKRSGLTMMPAIPTHPLDRMLAFLSSSKVVGPGNRLAALDQLPAGTALAPYPLLTVLTCPGVLEIVNSPAILRIVARYLGCKPTLASIGIRWSMPIDSEALPEVQTFHRDTQDWLFVTLFIYLTDVDAESGPHSFVTTSHNSSGTLRARSFTTAEVEKEYGIENIVQIVGPRGTNFIANTYGIHKGVLPLRRPRLMLQASYSLLPNFALRYRPEARVNRPALDPYINRLLLAF